MGKHFVLIHGAWHGGWCWEGVVRELVKAGHTAEAPTMPGHNPDDGRGGVTFENYIGKFEHKTRSVCLLFIGGGLLAFFLNELDLLCYLPIFVKTKNFFFRECPVVNADIIYDAIKGPVVVVPVPA
jgi:hypothetical protein